MKILLTLSIIPAIIISGCISEEDIKQVKNKTIGERAINYYSNKTVTSLEIPPDLTSPEYQNAFRLSEFVKDIDENMVSFSESKSNKKIKVRESFDGIEVKKSGDRIFITIDKEPDIVWSLAREFLKLQGFAINTADKKVGIIETDFLENRTEAPDQSIGLIRSLIRKGTGQSYSLPSVDKYRIRIEPINSGQKTELHLSLYSKEEVIKPTDLKEQNTVWKTKPRDPELEIEMLYRFMVFIGSDSTKAKEKIIQATENKKIKVEIKDGINGFSKLLFQEDIIKTWDSLSWAFDKLNLQLDDKDIMERSFYIRTVRTADEGIMTSIFGGEAVKKTFQIKLKVIDENSTEVLFIDISEENEQETKEYSYDLFKNIKKLF